MKDRIQRVPDLRSQVYDHLREAIRRGEFAADAKLQEHGIARDYGVSRTPAREALALLARDGLLVQDGRGFRFPRHTLDDIEKVFEMRQRLEPYAVRRATETASDAQLQSLAAIAEEVFGARHTGESYREANARLRAALYALCPNQRIVEVIEQHEDQIAFIRQATLSDPKWRKSSIRYFSKVIAHMVAREPAKAEQAMSLLLQESWRSIEAKMTAADPSS